MTLCMLMRQVPLPSLPVSSQFCRVRSCSLEQSDEFLVPIMGTLMHKPVRLPGSGNVVAYAVIKVLTR